MVRVLAFNKDITINEKFDILIEQEVDLIDELLILANNIINANNRFSIRSHKTYFKYYLNRLKLTYNINSLQALCTLLVNRLKEKDNFDKYQELIQIIDKIYLELLSNNVFKKNTVSNELINMLSCEVDSENLGIHLRKYFDKKKLKYEKIIIYFYHFFATKVEEGYFDNIDKVLEFIDKFILGFFDKTLVEDKKSFEIKISIIKKDLLLSYFLTKIQIDKNINIRDFISEVDIASSYIVLENPNRVLVKECCLRIINRFSIPSEYLFFVKQINRKKSLEDIDFQSIVKAYLRKFGGDIAEAKKKFMA